MIFSCDCPAFSGQQHGGGVLVLQFKRIVPGKGVADLEHYVCYSWIIDHAYVKRRKPLVPAESGFHLVAIEVLGIPGLIKKCVEF